MNRKIIWCSIVLVLVLGGSLAYVISCAREDVLVNTADSGGAIVFLDNDSHGTFALGRASADFRKNTVASSTVPSVETGTGGSSTYTATWEQDGNTELGDAKKAVFTLTVWDPAGVPHSTTMESDKTYSGTLSVSCSPHESGDGRFLLTSTVYGSRLNFSKVFS